MIENIDILAILFFSLFLISLIFLFTLKSKISQKDIELAKLSQNLEFLSKKVDDFLKNEQELLKNIANLEEQNIKLKIENSSLNANIDFQKENNQKLKDDLEEQGKKLELKLNEIMQNNLDNKLKKFDETSLKGLDNILKPFKENIDSFQKRVEESQENSTKKFAELSKEIEMLTKAGLNISQEAENLTKALKGKKQTQGSWGEMILESVLEYSGLLKNIHYFTQQSYKDEHGDTKRPDVIIKLPQNRSMIIDSKVSLNDYEEYIRAQSDEQRAISLNNIVSSFKNHIDNLDSKDYAHYKIGTLQYVFMFVPIEGAFSLAVQKDPTLYEYALKKHIAIVNPSTLTVSLRTIYLYWQSEQSSTLASKLFDEAGKLYDKMVNYTDSFNKIGNQIKALNNSYETASKQLSEGSGNILTRVENLKKLGAKTTKTLKDSKIEFEDFDENRIEVLMLEE
ncbi:DNA recombination protein RmuC [Aliarcobacter skirrowii]|uniref:DNA recombination protein n=1 Tax=Aliarcobacter skirrowii CCUG 10374 TaxID=1032239 RepID=A0AAD0SKZ6_9BACT|nr:DNA recombination protein RmuC [Aliarcobacter skirrowii]AXX84545.1 DNA recombination protein [Aliarcobacter skirrowii CCUG 10374]KAB0621283.1 DNA recombination protein RmuC [Aliarcobacter skirrowii CCUG 10374]MDD2509135.1 DNA recombination protein RmuC [Aliarcobacter skirrowii]MDD3497707.1 DNA recombination protein RmuC [Aliarcobacter skirrowii]MDX4060765.1 DNA recombination protein RmuC [Aliarcobacter skirrowii]